MSKTLPQLLEDAEKRRGVGKGTAARLCGVTRTTYRSWTRGQIPMGVSEVAGIIRFTEVTPNEVFRAVGLDDDILAVLGNRDKGLSLNTLLGSVRQPVPVAA